MWTETHGPEGRRKAEEDVTGKDDAGFQNKTNLIDDGFLFNAIVLEVVLNVQNQNWKIRKVIEV